MAVIGSSSDFKQFHTTLFSPNNHSSLVGLLDTLVQDEKCQPIVTKWMLPHVLGLVCKRIHIKMEVAKPLLWMNMGDISLEFIEQWDIHKIMGAQDTTPTLWSIIDAAGESKRSCAKPKTAKLKNWYTALLVIMVQLHYLCSRNTAKVQIGLGLQAWACGTLQQMVDVLHQTCLIVLYPSILTMRVKAAALCPHSLAYDNINISSSIFVKQGHNTMSKVQSGTFAVVYKLLNACPEDMEILPMLENLRCSSPLGFSDLHMTPGARQSYASQTAVTIVHILMKYVKGFEKHTSNALLQHTPRRPLPPGHKTVFHPLWATTIEEASIDGNLLVHNNVYLVQLKWPSDGLNKTALICKKDISPWECCEIFQLAFGSFHLAMNLLWCILKTHRGAMNQVGSLTHLFAVLEKTQLGGEHPDYHTLLSVLKQIIHGLILNAWQTECNHTSLSDFANANPMSQELLDCANCIFDKYAVLGPTTVVGPTNSKTPPLNLASGSGLPKLPVDVVHNNIALQMCDLL
ncbi:hypothetical protein V8E53_002108 [Lactarius tabidus]